MVDKRLRREAEFHDRRYSGEHESREGARKFYSIFAECRTAYLEKILEEGAPAEYAEWGYGYMPAEGWLEMIYQSLE